MVSESRVTWATSVPILVFLCLSVLELGPMYATLVRQTSDRQTSDKSITCLRPLGAGHNNGKTGWLSLASSCQVTHSFICWLTYLFASLLTFLSVCYAPAPIGKGHYAIMTVVCRYICFVCLSRPVPYPKSRMEGRSKLRIDRKEAHDTRVPWPHL